jgi:predicted permease
MRPVKRFLRRFGAWATRQDADERLLAEIEDHLAHQSAEYERAGLSPAEARRQALLKFGGVEATRDRWREERGLPALETIVQDTRHALRRLRMAPAFTIATVLVLALGIGATTAIFTLVHAVLLKSLPVRDPGELYRLGREARCCYWGGYTQAQEFSLVSYQLFTQLRDKTPGFTHLAAFSAGQDTLGVRRAGKAERAETYPGEFVSGNYFAMFGVPAYAGRTLMPADDRPGAPPAAVMSYRLWMQRFGGDPSIVGSVFNLNEKPFTVVGITPPGFYGDTLRSAPPDFFLPLNTEPLVNSDPALTHHDTHWLALIGRLQAGASSASIETRMRLELTRWLRSHWEEMSANDRAKLPEQTLFLRPGGAGITSMREQYQHWLEILMGVTGCTLLIVCANVATLMLVRGLERRRQTSLIIALGARRSRVVREPLIESLLLSIAGGAAGLAIAFGATRVILKVVFPSVPGAGDVPIDAWPSAPVLLFAFAVSLATGLAFGIAPAWMATRADPMEALRGTGRSTTRTGSLPRTVLIVFQAALSLVLLSAAGLLTAALYGLEHQAFGFEQNDRMVAQVNPRLAGYRPDQLTPLYDRIREAVSRVPGVSGVALCIYSPFGNNSWGTGIWVDAHASPGPNDDINAAWNRVTAGYFEVIGNVIVRGRGISGQDTATSRHVAVVNEAFARKFFKGEDPLGKRFGQHGIGSEREYEVVGVAKDARFFGWDLDKPVGAFFYLPEAQHDLSTTSAPADANPGSHVLRDIVIATRPGAQLSETSVRQAIASVDPALPITSVRPLREQVAVAFSQQRLIARLTSFFGLLSLVLASIGLYGVTAFNAGRRINEIGVRVALGATRGQVVRLVVRGAFGLILVGLIIGLPLTYAVGLFLGAQLYGTSPFIPAVVLAAALALAASAALASCVPAFRASLTSPVEALRVE